MVTMTDTETPPPDGESVAEEEEDTNKKGSQNEREAANIVGRVRGKGNVEKVNGYGNTDPWHCADVIAVGEGKVQILQVKTNSFTAADRRKYRREMRRMDFDHVKFEVWVRVDYEGWRMYRYNPETEEFEQYLEMDTCNHEATVEAYREHVGYNEDQEVNA
jgi:Holliday junction resolvase